MSQQEVGRIAFRVRMIRLLPRGYGMSEIAVIQQTSDETMYKWLARFDAESLPGSHSIRRSYCGKWRRKTVELLKPTCTSGSFGMNVGILYSYGIPINETNDLLEVSTLTLQ